MTLTAGGRLGLGATAPDELLELSASENPKIRFVDVGNLDAKIGIVGSTAMGFEVNGSERLRITSGGNVGIGTTSPSKKLDVFTTANSATEYQLSIRNGQGSNNVSSGIVFGFNTVSVDPDYLSAISSIITNRTTRAADLTFLTAATGTLTERLRITSTGNMGLGVTPSAWGANFKALQIGNRAALSTDSGISTALTNNAFHNGTNFTYSQTATALLYRQEGGQHEWFNAPSGTAGNAITFTQAMTLNASGNLSIGNTNDTYKLDVSGTGRFNGTSASPLLYLTNTTGGTSADFTITENAGLILNSYEGASARSIDLRVGGTSALLLASTGAATFSSSVTATGNAATTPSFIANNPSGASGTAQHYIDFTSGATVISRIFRGNGASGVVANGLNIDNFGGFQVRVNQLGGSGDSINLLGGNVGIGNTSASAKLHATGNILSYTEATNTASLFISANNSYNWQFGIGNNSNFVITEGGGLNAIGTERLRITSGGLVGIGRSAPDYLLEVNDSIKAFGQFVSEVNGTVGANFYGTGQIVSGASDQPSLYLDTTWNTTGNARGIEFNVNNTASGASSNLMNLKVDFASMFKVSKSGAITTAAPTGYTAKPWKLGEVFTGTITPDRHIMVEIDGNIYTIPVLLGTP